MSQRANFMPDLISRHLYLRAATLFGRSIMTLATDRNVVPQRLVFAQFDRDGLAISVSDPIDVGTRVPFCNIASLGGGRGIAQLVVHDVVPGPAGGAHRSRMVAHWLAFRLAKKKVTYKSITEPLCLPLHANMKPVVNGDCILWAACTGIEGGSFRDSRLTLFVSHSGKSITAYDTTFESSAYSVPVVVEDRVLLINSAAYHRLTLLDVTDPSSPEVVAEIDSVKRAKPPRRQTHQLASPHIVATKDRLRLIWCDFSDSSKGKPWAATIRCRDFDLKTGACGPIEQLVDDTRVISASLHVAAVDKRVTVVWESRPKRNGGQRGVCFVIDDPLPVQPVSLGRATTGHLLADKCPIYLSDTYYEPSDGCRIALSGVLG
jgi:hypothetical protein